MLAVEFFSAEKSLGLPILSIPSFLTGSPPFRSPCRPSSKACLDHRKPRASHSVASALSVHGVFQGACIIFAQGNATYPCRTAQRPPPTLGERPVLVVVAGMHPAWRWKEAPLLFPPAVRPLVEGMIQTMYLC